MAGDFYRKSLCLLMLGAFAPFSAFCDQIFYVGTFNPFHQTHLNELVSAASAHPKASVHVFPVETGYYNTVVGRPRPSFIPYELNLDMIRAGLRSQPGVTVSNDLRNIGTNVFDEILAVAAKSADPDKFVLVGSDILETWSKMDKFEAFKSKVKIIVGKDPQAVGRDQALIKRFRKDSRVQFIEVDSSGTRGSDIRRAIIERPAALSSMLPSGTSKYIRDKHVDLAKIRDDYLVRLREFNRELVLQETLPLLEGGGIPKDAIRAIGRSKLLQDAVVFTDLKDRSALIRLFTRIDAVRGVSAYERKQADLDEWVGKILKIDFGQPTEIYQYTRNIGVTAHEYFYLVGAERSIGVTHGARAPPEYLFHWTSDSKMRRMVETNVNPGKLPLRYIHSKQYVAVLHPELAGRSAIFAWHHPVTAMSGSEDELYAMPQNGKPARLLTMKVRPDARVVEIKTNMSSFNIKYTPEIDEADILLNRTYQNGKFSYSEWIVLNPDAVVEFSADPDVLRPVLEEEIRKMQTPGYRYHDSELFMPSYDDRERRTKVLRELLEKGSEGIPFELRRPLGSLRPQNQWGCVAEAFKNFIEK